ncbi:MAG: hypothetical protein K6G10_01515 [Butyrivibrio sp.]|nr:hypothetical protein [Butyrivibrio sp.]
MELKFAVKTSSDALPAIACALFVHDGHIYEAKCREKEMLQYNSKEKEYLITWPDARIRLYGDIGYMPDEDALFIKNADFLDLVRFSNESDTDIECEYFSEHRPDKKNRWIKDIYNNVRFDKDNTVSELKIGSNKYVKVQLSGLDETFKYCSVKDVSFVYALFNLDGNVEGLEYQGTQVSQLKPVSGSFGELLASMIVADDEENKIYTLLFKDRFPISG